MAARDDTGDPYDRLPYTDHAYAEAHPDRLATVARLCGWEAPGVGTARVLELGCGRGGNLLPMASALPDAVVTGVDRSRRQIDEARAIAATAGLKNTRFVEASFEELRDVGPFDYVLAHGVASWVAPASRRALLATVAGALAPAGVAYVSFNVLPGWYERMAARDWWRFERGADARASIGWLRDHVSPEKADYRRRLDAVAARVSETDLAYFTHEYLADEHHPQLVGALLAEAADAGLAYLGDAIPAETAFELVDGEVLARARAMGVAEAQQLVDFVRNTAFRRALFVRADEAAARRWRWTAELDAERLEGLRLASRLRPAGEPAAGAHAERFDAGDVSVQVEDATARRALRELALAAPRSLPFPELARRVDTRDPGALRRELFDLWLATGALDLHVNEPDFTVAPGARPVACPVARWHAVHGGAVTNRWHHEVRLDDAPLRRVLGLLDGARALDDVATAAGCPVEVARASVEALAAAALVVA
ncbi:MAG TPA: class I SAM-dependent methyltransferase [Polyangiaceae bacterium]